MRTVLVFLPLLETNGAGFSDEQPQWQMINSDTRLAWKQECQSSLMIAFSRLWKHAQRYLFWSQVHGDSCRVTRCFQVPKSYHMLSSSEKLPHHIGSWQIHKLPGCDRCGTGSLQVCQKWHNHGTALRETHCVTSKGNYFSARQSTKLQIIRIEA